MSQWPCLHYRRNLLLASFACLCLYASSAWAQTVSMNGVSVPLFGVPLTVLAMAAAGSLVGFAYGQPVQSRKALYAFAFANTLIGAWAAVLIPEWRGWEVSPMAQPPLAGALAAVARFTVPAFIEGIPAVVRRLMGAIGNAAQAPKAGDQ